MLLPLVCHNLKYSVYYLNTFADKNEAKDAMRADNTQRLTEAKRYIQMLDQTKLHRMLGHEHKGKELDVVISIVTVSRNRHKIDSYEPRYLTQVVSRLLYLMHNAVATGFPYSLQLEICNVDHDPQSYEEAKSLVKYVSMVNRFNKTYLTIDHPLEKEKKDYVFCLNMARKYNPRHILLMEDDAIPIDDFFPVLQHTISHHLDQKYNRGAFHPVEDHIAYVKLYHPERLTGFISLEPERIPEWMAYALIFSSISAAFYCQQNGRINVSFHLAWFVLFVYFVAVVFLIGRQHLNEFRRLLPPHLYSFVPAPSCCTPAMLFPRAGADVVIDYLNNVRCKMSFGKDIALEQFLQQSSEPRWRAFLVQPNIVSHIGMYSALRAALVDPFLV